jgi:hypothetical protein
MDELIPISSTDDDEAADTDKAAQALA